MFLLLIRHAEPVKVVDAPEAADPELRERGELQAKLLADYLAEEEIDAIYTSPKRRARQTAAPLAERSGVPAEVVAELSEFDRLATSYVPIEEMRATGDERYLAMLRDDFSAYGIDMDQFRREVVGALETIVARHPGHQVAVVCHGGVINAYAGHIIGLTKHAFFAPAYTGINRIAASRDGVRTIVALNEVAHLRGRGLLVS